MVVLQVSTWQDWTMFPRMTFLVCFCLVISLYKIWKTEVMEQLFCSSHTLSLTCWLTQFVEACGWTYNSSAFPWIFLQLLWLQGAFVYVRGQVLNYFKTSTPLRAETRRTDTVSSILTGSSLCLGALPRSLFLVSITWDPSSLPDFWILSFSIRWKDNRLTETAS